MAKKITYEVSLKEAKEIIQKQIPHYHEDIDEIKITHTDTELTEMQIFWGGFVCWVSVLAFILLLISYIF